MTANVRLGYSSAIALLFASAAASASDAPSQCTTSGGGWTVNVSAPFEPVSCPAERCTGLTYNLTPRRGETPDHVAVLVDHEPPIVIPPSTFTSAPCSGDTVSGLGFRDCSSQTARINQSQQKTGPFDLVVEGVVKPIGASIVVKKGKVIEQCRIASLGAPFEVFDPHAQVRTSETIQFKHCEMTIPVDPITGEPGEATLTGTGCKFVANGSPVQSLSLTVDGVPLGNGNWAADGGVSTGSNSCTTRTISGRLYSFCTCTASTDPRPPC
jgi:hypothetical protein